MMIYPETVLIICAVLLILMRRLPGKQLPIFIVSLSVYFLTNIMLGSYGFEKIGFLRLIFSIIIFCSGIYTLYHARLRETICLLLYGGSAIHILDSNNLVEIFCFIELMMISAAYIIFMGENKASKAAGLRYLKMHIIAGTFILLGVINHYEHVGSFAVGAIPQEFIARTGLLNANFLLGVGFLINAAIFPFSAWLPDSYPRATSSGSMILSVLTTKISIYLMAKFYFGFELLVPFGFMTIIYAFFYMFISTQLRRVIAYYLIMQNGILLTLVGGGYVSDMGYLIGLSSLYSFFSMFVISYLKGEYNVGSFVQLGHRTHYKNAGFTLLLLGFLMVGLPFTISFPVKYYAGTNQLFSVGKLVDATLFLTSIAILGKIYSFYKKHKKLYFCLDKAICALIVFLVLVGLVANINIENFAGDVLLKIIYVFALVFVCGLMKSIFIQKEDRLFPDIDWVYRKFLYGIYHYSVKYMIIPAAFNAKKVFQNVINYFILLKKKYIPCSSAKLSASLSFSFYSAATLIILIIFLVK